MHAAQNYIYILFAVLYIIYSIVKAAKKNAKNPPVSSSNPQTQKKEDYMPVQPPVSSPAPDPGEDIRKMLEQVLGRNQESKAAEKKTVASKQHTGQLKTPPKLVRQQWASKETPTSRDDEKKSFQKDKKEKAAAHHLPERSHKTEKPFLAGEQITHKKKETEMAFAEEESSVDFDFRRAVIYSEILKRPQY
jgi:hypothetical protein